MKPCALFAAANAGPIAARLIASCLDNLPRDNKCQGDAVAKCLRVRFELIALLAQRDFKEDLLTELLPVEDWVPRDLKARVRMGRLLLHAGSPLRSADVFRGILQEAPADAYARCKSAPEQPVYLAKPLA